MEYYKLYLLDIPITYSIYKDSLEHLVEFSCKDNPENKKKYEIRNQLGELIKRWE